MSSTTSLGRTIQIGVVQYEEITERTVETREPPSKFSLPDRTTRRLRNDQRDPFALMVYQAIDEHEADEGLAQSDAVAQEGAAETGQQSSSMPGSLLFDIGPECGRVREAFCSHSPTVISWPLKNSCSAFA